MEEKYLIIEQDGYELKIDLEKNLHLRFYKTDDDSEEFLEIFLKNRLHDIHENLYLSKKELESIIRINDGDTIKKRRPTKELKNKNSASE